MSEIRVGLIGGSGLGAALSAQHEGTRHQLDTPFGKPSDAIIETRVSDVSLFILNRHGPGHLLNPSQVPYRANIFALKQLGVTHIIASGAVGSLREEFKPRNLVVPDQLIDKTHRREQTFYDSAAVHVEFAEPFCSTLRQILIESAGDATVHARGCYVTMEGPAFSTRAESLMHRLWGGDLIGMTAMPEAKLAREAEIAYALIALVTDYDCWRAKPPAKEGAVAPEPAALLEEITANLQAAVESAAQVIKRAVERIGTMSSEQLASPAHTALKLGIWSDRARIPVEQVQRLAPLWAKHFQ